jgi:hypothetical protein
MPDWTLSLLATFVGAAAALAGVWVQLRAQRQREEREGRAARTGLFGRVLGLLAEFSPERIDRMAKTADIGTVSEIVQTRQRLNPLREGLAVLAANEPDQADLIFELIGHVTAYFECLPVVESGGDSVRLRPRVAQEEVIRLHQEAVVATQRAAASYQS